MRLQKQRQKHVDSAAKPSRFWAIIRIILSLIIIVATVWIFMNRQFAIDSIAVWRYEPTPEISGLSQRSSMSDRGEFLFYASQPQISDRETFLQQCQAHSEQTAILGCYAAMRIYLFDVVDERLDGIEEVTAAHEMLHAAYDRMSTQEKRTVERLVEQGYEQVKDKRLTDLLKLYEDAEPGHRVNELFAILGTEYEDLPQELENIYGDYFNNRSAVVQFASQYRSTFDELAEKQTVIVNQLNELADKIADQSEQYNSSVSRLSSDIEAFNQRAESGSFESQFEFNTIRNELVARQAELVSSRESIVSMVSRYENLRDTLSEINLVATELIHSINPSLPETPEL